MFETLNNGDIIGNIRKAGQSRKTLMIEYKDTKGNVTERETEPYEIKQGAYWGFDIEKGSIRRFSITNILSNYVTDNDFVPQWPVKL